jgi:hypothetical protein
MTRFNISPDKQQKRRAARIKARRMVGFEALECRCLLSTLAGHPTRHTPSSPLFPRKNSAYLRARSLIPSHHVLRWEAPAFRHGEERRSSVAMLIN